MESKLKRSRITCGRCGFITHDADDMIRHLSCTQDIPSRNCTEKGISIEKIINNKGWGRPYGYDTETPAEKGKKAIKRLRERNT